MNICFGDRKVEVSDVVVQFFYFFSRFEYALKRCKYNIGENNGAKADWDKFGNDLDEENLFSEIVESDESFKKACDYLFDNSPKKQIARDYEISWTECPVDGRDFKNLFILVRRVRNNLFHGGKFPDMPIEGSERDELLLNNCLIILEKCRALNESINSSFLEEA
jgi:hypothetical protein